jgi:alpha-amylase
MTVSARVVLVVGLFCLSERAIAQTASNDFWQGQSIYQVVTDRFYDGDPSNNNADRNYNPSRSRGAHGGDFKGLEQKLDYIKALGSTAIWISPVVRNAKGEYHGYAGRDFYKVDARWGTLQDLRHLVDAAHARGLLVIDDVVVNHGGDLIYSTDSGYGSFRAPPDGYHLSYREATRTYPPPFDLNATNKSLTNLFHNNGLIYNWQDTNQLILGELAGLDDFRTESPYVRKQMELIYEYWIEQAGFDGFRVDTVKHVETGFWQEWCPRIHAFAGAHGKPNFFMFGEVLDGSDALCGSFTGKQSGGAFELDAVLDYPLYFAVKNVFARGAGAPSSIEEHYRKVDGCYDPSARGRLVTFLDNHDQPRFLSKGEANNRIDRLKSALVFLYTSRGVPCLYYGTEQAFNGGTDPADREDMFAGQFKDGARGVDSFNMTHPVFLWVAQLNNFRRLYAPLCFGSQLLLWTDTDGPGLFAYARRWQNREVAVILNTARQTRSLPACPTILSPGATLVNLLDTNETHVVTPGGRIPEMTLPPGGAKILIDSTLAQQLEPMVVESYPAHDARNVADDTAVDLRFSEAMDTESVEKAFSTEPPATGIFSWSPERDKVTFTPGHEGFPTGTEVRVRLAASAKSAEGGRTFYAAYESEFNTR